MNGENIKRRGIFCEEKGFFSEEAAVRMRGRRYQEPRGAAGLGSRQNLLLTEVKSYICF